MMNEQVSNMQHTLPMFSIVEAEYIVNSLPDYKELDINDFNNKKYDILILANGFEDRANAFINEVSSKNYKTDTVLIAKYKTNPEDNKKMYGVMYESVKKITNTIDHIDADKQQNTNQKIWSTLNSITKKNIKVVFDISSASDRLILSVLHSLMEEKTKEIALYIVYYEAENYVPSFDDWKNNPEKCVKQVINSDIQESGVEQPFYSQLYNGHFENSYSNFLISIPTLKLNRPFAALYEHDENFFINQTKESIYWILGKPEEHAWREELQRRVLKQGLIDKQAEHLLSEYNTISCSTLNYKNITQELFSVIDKNVKNRCNITIMPMGSKMQTIGVSLVLFARSECKVMLAKPKVFNKSKYTDGVGKSWILELNLDCIKEELVKIGCYSNKPVGKQSTDQLPS